MAWGEYKLVSIILWVLAPIYPKGSCTVFVVVSGSPMALQKDHTSLYLGPNSADMNPETYTVSFSKRFLSYFRQRL